MGEGQWFQPTVQNNVSQTIVLTNVSVEYGKIYDINNPYNETTSFQGTRIPSNGQFEWGACGRQGSPTGTTGTFDVQLDGGDTIAVIYWDCPLGGSNTLETRSVQDGYVVSFNNFSTSGALGKGTISILEE